MISSKVEIVWPFVSMIWSMSMVGILVDGERVSEEVSGLRFVTCVSKLDCLQIKSLQSSLFSVFRDLKAMMSLFLCEMREEKFLLEVMMSMMFEFSSMVSGKLSKRSSGRSCSDRKRKYSLVRSGLIWFSEVMVRLFCEKLWLMGRRIFLESLG